MKYLLLFLISLPGFSNTFRLSETGARFYLSITTKEVLFQSERSLRKIEVKDCNRHLAKELNSELLGKIPSTSSKNGLKIFVDDKEVSVDPKSSVAAFIGTMEMRFMRFSIEEKKACI